MASFRNPSLAHLEDLLDTLERAGKPISRLEDVEPDILTGPIVADWTDRAVEHLHWLSLVLMRPFAPDAIAIDRATHLSSDFEFGKKPGPVAEQE